MTFTSPRLRGEVDRAQRGWVWARYSKPELFQLPLTPTLSP